MPVDKLRDLLEEKAFVDYFNLFLSQPIFGFRLLYKFSEKKFAINSSLKYDIKKMTNSKLLTWLESKRLPLFIQSSMYSEYKLCTQLREIKMNKEDFLHICDAGYLDDTFIKVIVENIFGHYTGMQQFKKFLLGTEGEKIWQCLNEVMFYCNKKISVKMMRYELHQLIRKYLANGILFELTSRMKLYLFLESDPLKNPPMENAVLDNGIGYDECLFHKGMLNNEPEKAMLRFYSFLVQDLLTYWAPCFVLNLLQKRISFGLDCLCTLDFTETPGSFDNILNLFDFSASDCPLFISEQEYNPKDYKQKPVKVPFNTQEYLFGDESICETFGSINHKMMTILASDHLSGYPFLRFLMQTEESKEDQIYFLWEDLCKYITIRRNDDEYRKNLQEGKIKTLYLLKDRKSQDDLLDDDIKQIALNGFKTTEAEEREKTKKLLKATNMTTDILENLWRKYVDFEKKNMKNDFELESIDDDDAKSLFDDEECISLFDEGTDGKDHNEQAIMVDFYLSCFDIKQLRKSLTYSKDVLLCLFNDSDQKRISLASLKNKRNYQLGMFIFRTMRTQSKMYKKRAKRERPHRPPPRKPARIFKKEPQVSLRLVSDLKSKVKTITYEQKTKEAKLRNYGLNPYLSLRQEGFTFAAVNKQTRKRIVFQKYLRSLCQFFHEMMQPCMKELLTAYLDGLIKNSEFLASKEIEKTQKYKKRRQLSRHVLLSKTSPIYYMKMRKKVIYLTESLQFKRTAYKMLSSCKRTKINLHLKSKARRIINTFLEGDLFLESRKNFVFGSSKDRTEDIINDTALKLKLEGASCSLFHKLDIHVIPEVYQIWKKMSRDCLNCEGRGKFLAALGIDKVAFDKKYFKSMKEKRQMSFEKSERIILSLRFKKTQLEEQASQMTKSMQLFANDDIFWKYRRQFAYSIGECISPDLRKLIQHRGGSQLEYVLVR